MQCHAQRLYVCRCPVVPEIIDLPGITYYHANSMIMIGGSLYTLLFPSKGRHYVDAMMGAVSSGTAYSSVRFRLIGRVCLTLSTTVPNQHTGTSELVWWTVVPCTWQALAVQRWLRRMLYKVRAQRRLALAMALHPRLGGQSPLAVLCADHVGVVGKMI